MVEEEWLVTLATVDREEVTYLDFVIEGTKLAKELRDEVSISFAIIVSLVSVYLFAIRSTQKKEKNLTIETLMVRKSKRSQRAYREWAPSDK